MKLPRASLAAIAVLVSLCLPVAAEAHSRASAGPTIYAWSQETPIHTPHWRKSAPAIAVAAAWGGGSALVHEAANYVGSGKFTPYPRPWCSDAVSAWLQHVGKPPLANRMASAALSYGPRSSGSPGDLAVFLNRRGYAYHVGIVVADLGGQVEIVSGNWSHRVARAVVSRGGLIFIRT
jgi:hypothetical protein